MRLLLPFFHFTVLEDRLETITIVVKSVSTRVLACVEVRVGQSEDWNAEEVKADAVAVDVGVLVRIGSGTAIHKTASSRPAPLSVLLGLLAASLDVVLVFLLELLHAAVLLELGGFGGVRIGSLDVGVLSSSKIAELRAGLERGVVDRLWQRSVTEVYQIFVLVAIPQVLPLEQREHQERPPGQGLAMQQRRRQGQR